jgi:hypothetical protein
MFPHIRGERGRAAAENRAREYTRAGGRDMAATLRESAMNYNERAL